MSEMRVLGRRGDERLTWNSSDPESLKKATKRFNEWKKTGGSAFRIAIVQKDGLEREERGERLDEFDPSAEKIVLVPRMVGG